MSNENLSVALAILPGLTQEELYALNAAVISTINRLNARRSEEALANFHIGQYVKFDSRKRGRVIAGRIVKINYRTCSLDCGTNGPWKVDAPMLTPITKEEFEMLTGTGGTPIARSKVA